MTDAAISQVLLSAAPGQLDAVAESLTKMKCNPGAVLDKLRQEQQQFACLTGNESVSHALAGPVKEKLAKYQKNTFSGPKVTSRLTMASSSNKDQFVVCTYVEKMDAANQCAGYWKSTWTITAGSGAKEAQVEGTVQLQTYSYEDGNVHLKTSKTYPAKKVKESPGTDDPKPTLASGVVNQIIGYERQVMGLLASLHNSSAENLKQIRRILPITKTKMKWEVAAQRGMNLMKKSTPAKK